MMSERTNRRRLTSSNFAACVTLESFVGDTIPAVHHITPRTYICDKCYALLFKHETQNICCKKGAVQLPDWHPPHNYIRQLFVNGDATSKKFLKNI
jgi:hypothetical protein